MLKDILKKNINVITGKKKEDPMPFQLKGKLTIIGEKNGEVFHYDEGNNVVTIWAKHSTMHLLTSESYSSHGNKIAADGETMIYSSRSINEAHHQAGIMNLDGTLVSEEQYLGDNANYFGSGMHRHLSRPANMTLEASAGDDLNNGGFIFPFFPTKMLFGTGVEFSSWADVAAAGRNGPETDITSYVHPKNGGWNQNDFNNMIPNQENYYSDIWDQASKNLTRARTVNDVYSGILQGAAPAETDHGIPGAIKDATYRGISEFSKLEVVDGKQFARGSYRGIGRPSFVYAKRGRFFREGSEARLQIGSTAGTEHLESKITFSVVLPEQPDGAFYPYNGYTLKMAGLFCDVRMLLGNKVPVGDYVNMPTETDLTSMEYSNYMKMPGGIMWAKRKIAPIYKSHDVKVTAQWTIYLP
jgi:hypothetical protein